MRQIAGVSRDRGRSWHDRRTGAVVGTAPGAEEREMQIRPMRRDELDVLVGWAADEGWNPGRTDADIFWGTDPNGFIAAELDGELIGGGSIVDHGGSYGFMGFFIIRPDKRGHGLGGELWFRRRDLLLERLGPGATIEMDGVSPWSTSTPLAVSCSSTATCASRGSVAPGTPISRDRAVPSPSAGLPCRYESSLV
jgi:hypothetical protein